MITQFNWTMHDRLKWFPKMKNDFSKNVTHDTWIYAMDHLFYWINSLSTRPNLSFTVSPSCLFTALVKWLKCTLRFDVVDIKGTIIDNHAHMQTPWMVSLYAGVNLSCCVGMLFYIVFVLLNLECLSSVVLSSNTSKWSQDTFVITENIYKKKKNLLSS